MKDAETGSSDADLAIRTAHGDDHAFAALIQRHKESIYRFIRRYVGDSDEAYDVLQDTLVAAWRAIGRYDPRQSFSGWLYSIALNKCRDWSRRRAVRKWLTRSDPLDSQPGLAIPDNNGSPEDTAADRQTLRRLDRAVAELPHGLKEPLILSVLEERSHAEVGALLGLSAKAVEVRVYRARKLLTEKLRLTGTAKSEK